MHERLLLVDDEDGIRRFLGLSLTDRGFDVRTAADGHEALAVMEEFDPAIVLTDIKMPGMDGIELLKAVKAARPKVEVVMISGHGDMDLAIASLKLQAADFVTKPVNDEILDAALNRVRDKLAMQRQLADYTRHLEAVVEEKSARLVELERQAAVGQVVEGLAGALTDMARSFEGDAGIMEGLPFFVTVHNRALEVVSANPPAAMQLGVRPGDDSWDRYADESSRGLACPVGRTFAQGRGQQARRTMLDALGREFPVLVRTAPVSGTGGNIQLVMEIAVDLTEVEDLREELRATREKYRLLFAEAPCAITVQDQHMRITAANRRYKEDFGHLGVSLCRELFENRKQDPLACPVQQTFADGRQRQIEDVLPGCDGEPRNLLITTTPIRDARGEISEVMELSTDITELRRLQDHLASLGLMLGSMSHGIKGMLTALDGGLYRLQSGIAKDDPARVAAGAEALSEIIHRVKAMVLDVLYYAKSRALDWCALDAGALARQVAGTVAPRAERAGVVLDVRIEDGMGGMEADANALSSALVNILENAVDACVADGSKDAHAVGFTAAGTDGSVVFTVADDGLGMDRETLEKIFTLFFSSKGKKGTGLGLFIANQVVERHGGRIEVQSEPRAGARFTVTLPRVLPEGVKAAPETDPDAGRACTMPREAP